MSTKKPATRINELKREIKSCADNLACYVKDYISQEKSKEQLKSLIISRALDINLFVNDLVAIALKPEKEKKENPDIIFEGPKEEEEESKEPEEDKKEDNDNN